MAGTKSAAQSRDARAPKKIYLYAIAPASNGWNLGPIGVGGGTVYGLTHGPLAAVVSEVGERLRPERRQLAAHQQVLKQLMQDGGAVLPVTFGVVADGPAEILRILARNEKPFLAEIRRVTGRVEMGLRVTWDVSNIFEYFVESHPDLRAARDRFFGGRHEPTQDDKMELGRLFERLLMEERDAQTERVVAVLGPVCAEIKRNKPRNEREVVNLACLVEADGQERFEAAVFAVAALFDTHYAFDFNGPWAPHNFVDLRLDL